MGKLPVTVYPADYVNKVDLFDFDMSKAPGRTYRYYQGTPLFKFGFGLSLTEFKFACIGKKDAKTNLTFQISCNITNTGTRDGDEVMQVYHRLDHDIKVSHPVPQSSLVDFARVRVARGASSSLSFVIGEKAFAVTDTNGDRVILPGTHYVDVSNGAASHQLLAVDVTEQKVIDIAPQPDDAQSILV